MPAQGNQHCQDVVSQIEFGGRTVGLIYQDKTDETEHMKKSIVNKIVAIAVVPDQISPFPVNLKSYPF